MRSKTLTTAAGDRLVVHRFGVRGARPHVYFQGGLHADEVSSSLALTLLVNRLEGADRQGRVIGEVTIVPHCNPIGLKQFHLGRHQGRFSLADGKNFNRGFPDFAEELTPVLLSTSGQSRRETALNAGRQGTAVATFASPVEPLQRELMRLSWGADVVIDVHADMEASVHIYSSHSSWEKMQSLAARMSAQVVILSEESADLPFDEAHSRAWHKLGMDGVTASCTLELRGLADVSMAMAEQDSEGLMHFLADVGVLASQTPDVIAVDTAVISLSAVEFVLSPRLGMIVHEKQVGDMVKAGDLVARVFDPSVEDRSSAWSHVEAKGDGVIFARWHQRVIDAGMPICKIAGKNNMMHGGERLLD